MKSAENYLQEAKEKMAKIRKTDIGGVEWYWMEEASLLALQLQQEDAEKARASWVKETEETSFKAGEAIAVLSSEIEQLKSELSQAKEEKELALDEMQKFRLDLDGLRSSALKRFDEYESTLSQEKAKAFDEGVDKAILYLGMDSYIYIYPKNQLRLNELVNKAKTINPYKQDTQPKDK